VKKMKKIPDYFCFITKQRRSARDYPNLFRAE